MTQNVERAKAISKIRKLAAQTIDAGCTEGQMNQALTMIDKLMQQYNIDMNEVDIREEPCITMKFDTGNKKAGALGAVLVGIGKYLGLRVWQTKPGRYSNNNVIYSLFGRESDVLVGLYLMETIQKAMENETKRFMRGEVYNRPAYRGEKRVRLANFKKSFSNNIAYRLTELTDGHKAEITSGTDLVVVKSAYVEEEFAKIGMKLTTQRSYYRSRFDAASHSSGREAAKSVNLNRPVGNTSQTLQLR